MSDRHRSFVEVPRDRVSDWIEKYFTRTNACEVEDLIDAIAKAFSCDSSSSATRRQIKDVLEYEVKMNRIYMDGSVCRCLSARVHMDPVVYPSRPQKAPARLPRTLTGVAKTVTPSSGKTPHSVKPPKVAAEARRLLQEQIKRSGGYQSRTSLIHDVTSEVMGLASAKSRGIHEVRRVVGEALQRYLRSGYFTEYQGMIYSGVARKKIRRQDAQPRGSVITPTAHTAVPGQRQEKSHKPKQIPQPRTSRRPQEGTHAPKIMTLPPKWKQQLALAHKLLRESQIFSDSEKQQ